MLLFTAFLGAALLLYGPALEGPFVSDDIHYVRNNPYVHEWSLANALVILDPFGAATVAVVNYSPVQLLIHNTAWQVFGDRVTGHHVVNVILHALASTLLVALLLSSGIPRVGAIVGGAFFLLHPANVEAVAWISQLKTTSALVLALLALLAFPRRPALASVAFALSLLAKPVAAVVLPVALLLEWTRENRVRWRWFVLWAVFLAGFAAVEFAAHQRSGAAEAVLYETPFALLRTVAALALRYLVMAATSWGASAFHEPEPAWSPFDPWFLASLVALGLLGWRFVVALRARREEVAYWSWALISFAPVSQLFPFLYPMGDRYLYFMLPGLIGAVLLAGRDALAAGPGKLTSRAPAFAALAAVVVLLGFFAWRSHGRAAIWRSGATLVADAAKHYPDGVSASLLRANRAATSRDVDAAVAALRAAMARGYNRWEQLQTDSIYDSIRSEPAFQAVIREIAGGWIERSRGKQDPTQLELRFIAHSHFVRGERREAIAMLRRALEVGGPRDVEIRQELAQLGSPVD